MSAPHLDGVPASRWRRWLLSNLFQMAVVAVTLVGFALRVGYLAVPARIDEAFTYRYVSSALGIAISNYDLPNNHLFHTLLVKASTQVFGNHLWSLRLPAFVAGVALVPVTAGLVARLANRHAALIAAALVAGSAPLISFSVRARGYTIVGLAFLVLVWLGHRIIASDRSLALWIGFSVTAVIGIWTVPTMLYGFSGVVVWLALGLRRDRSSVIQLLAAVGGTALGVALVYLPVVLRSGLQAIVSNRFVEPRPLPVVAAGLPAWVRSVGEQWTTGLPAWGTAILVAAVVFAVASSRERRLAGVFATTVLVTLGFVLAQRRLPFERTTFFLLPVFFALAAAGLSRLTARFRGITGAFALTSLALTVAVLFGISSNKTPLVRDVPFPDVEAVVQTIEREGGERPTVYAGRASKDPLQYHLVLHDVSLDSDPSDGGAVFAVVNHARNETLEDALARAPDEVRQEAAALVEVASFPQATLYGPADLGNAESERP